MCKKHAIISNEASPLEKWKAVAHRFEHTEFGRPIINAFSLADMPKHYAAICCFCGRLHFHGADEGPRSPHCRTNTEGLPEYYLRYAGPLPDELRPQLRRHRQGKEYDFEGTPHAVEVVDPPICDPKGRHYADMPRRRRRKAA